MEGSRGRWRWWGGRRRSLLMVALALCFVAAVVSLCCCCCARPGACSGRSTVAVLRSGAVKSRRQRETAAADGGRAGVVPAAVHVQVRQLQPVLPGARGRAAGGAGHHGVLPGGVAVQVRQPALHAMIGAKTSRDVKPRWPVGVRTDRHRSASAQADERTRRRRIIARGRAARPRLQLEQCHGCRGAPASACMGGAAGGWWGGLLGRWALFLCVSSLRRWEFARPYHDAPGHGESYGACCAGAGRRVRYSALSAASCDPLLHVFRSSVDMILCLIFRFCSV